MPRARATSLTGKPFSGECLSRESNKDPTTLTKGWWWGTRISRPGAGGTRIQPPSLRDGGGAPSSMRSIALSGDPTTLTKGWWWGTRCRSLGRNSAGIQPPSLRDGGGALLHRQAAAAHLDPTTLAQFVPRKVRGIFTFYGSEFRGVSLGNTDMGVAGC